ncbi:MAG TPA: YtxH domain-containing protein [Candidatus Angelobacter sp.]
MNEYERYGEYTQTRVEQPSGNAGAGRAIAFLLIGMGIGAAAALLLAPMSGADCREAIRRGYRSTLDSISEQTRNLRERGSNLLGFNRRKRVNE